MRQMQACERAIRHGWFLVGIRAGEAILCYQRDPRDASRYIAIRCDGSAYVC